MPLNPTQTVKTKNIEKTSEMDDARQPHRQTWPEKCPEFVSTELLNSTYRMTLNALVDT